MITPLDIENKKFSKQMMNGYSVEEVDDFLDELTVDYEKTYKQSSELKTRVDELEKSLLHYKTIEDTLQNTLVMAQTTAEDINKMAQQQADQIIAEANSKAKKSVEELDRQEFELRAKLEEKKKEYELFKSKMERFLLSQLDMLKDEEEE